MNSTKQPRPSKTLAFVFGLGLIGLLIGVPGLTSQALAQTIYRIVAPDGKVTFSDKPTAAAAKITSTDAAGKTIGEGSVALPFELRQVVNKYPVTLYTSNNCAPCNSGRSLLTGRGIVFAEKAVNTADDAQALQRISGESSLPFLTIGAQQIKGYSESEWTQFLDAAGYPKSSTLPAAYRNPAATPLVMVQKQAPDAPTEANQTAPDPVSPATAQPNRPATNNVSNPAGIQF